MLFKLILSFGLLSSNHAMAVIIPEVGLSPATKEFVLSNFEQNCSLKVSDSNFIKYYLKSETESVVYKKISFNLLKSTIESGCDNEFNKNFNTQLKRDLLPYHQAKLDRIKEEIEEFREKNLSASALMAEYLNYKKQNDVEDIVLDPSVAELFNKNKKEFEKRKDSCSDVMNLKEPLSLDVAKDQGQAGWCYAYAASDMIAHVTGKNPSALYMSTLMNGKFLARMVGLKNGGLIDWTINELISQGMCLEKDLPSSYHKFADDERRFTEDAPHLQKVFDQVVDLANKYKNTSNVGENIEFTPSYEKESVKADLCSSDKNQLIIADIMTIFPGLKMDQLVEILLESRHTDAFKKLAKVTCPISDDPDLKNVVVKSNFFNKFETIDRELTKGNIVGMNYDANVLVDYTKRDALKIHASTLVGRKFNPETMSCEYLLRNSWGNSCDTYDKRFKCSNGHIWIPEDFLKFNNPLTNVYYAEKKQMSKLFLQASS